MTSSCLLVYNTSSSRQAPKTGFAQRKAEICIGDCLSMTSKAPAFRVARGEVLEVVGSGLRLRRGPDWRVKMESSVMVHVWLVR
jgi:hypothetical protein